MTIFDTKMTIFDTKMIIFETKMKIFDTKMKIFDPKMTIFDTKMTIFIQIAPNQLDQSPTWPISIANFFWPNPFSIFQKLTQPKNYFFRK